MTNIELQQLQKRIKFDAPSMAASLNIDYEQYRRFYYNHAAIPASIELAALELEKTQKRQDIERDREYCAFLDTQYPHGILSELLCE